MAAVDVGLSGWVLPGRCSQLPLWLVNHSGQLPEDICLGLTTGSTPQKLQVPCHADVTDSFARAISLVCVLQSMVPAT